MTVATALLSYLNTAAKTMTGPECTQVGQGEPDVVNLPTLAYWFMGVRTWEANTFSKTQELSWWHIRIYLPVTARFAPQNAVVDDWMVTFTDAIRDELFANEHLGGAATGWGFNLSDPTAGWMQVGNQLNRVVEMDIEVMLAAVHTIAAPV